jgi:hypothetical protein
MKRMTLLTLSLALPLAAAAPAAAHQIWLEQDARAARLYFGEFGDNLREASPGLLDKFGQPTARLISAGEERPVPLTKTAGAIVLSATARTGQSIVVEDTRYPIIERRDGDKKLRKLWTPAARHVTGFAELAPKLVLDVLPAGKPGTVLVLFRDKRLPKAKVVLMVPSGWTREAQTDDEGKVSFPTPWKGTYLVYVHHEEAKPGKRPGPQGDEAYDAASFSTTLSFVSRTGLPALPPPPPAPPNS